MNESVINLLGIARGSVTAPAGCGKTELIVKTLAQHNGGKPVLILTHTNAGVAALRSRLARSGIPTASYRVGTIDGWAMRLIGTFPTRSGHNPAILQLRQAASDYPSIREAAWRLLEAGHISDVIRASYTHVIVDEYQDCSLAQHYIVCCLAKVIPACVLGDPMQAIFNFKNQKLVDWTQDVLPWFTEVARLSTPWRWRNAGTEPLGQWLLAARESLLAGGKVDLRLAPPQLRWIPITAADAHQARIGAAAVACPTELGRVLIIGDSTSPSGQQQIASQTFGAVTVESVELRDLIEFCSNFDLLSAQLATQLLTFAQGMLSNLGASELKRRLDTLRRGTAVKPPSPGEHAALEFERAPSYASAASLLMQWRGLPEVRCYRPDIFRGALKALENAHSGACTLAEAAIKIREEGRMTGRALPRRAVGSTLLLKGLESEVAVILNADVMNAAHLYVALTRGSMQVHVCSMSPVLG